MNGAPESGPGAGPTGRLPLLLFDGVCNLCNAAVQWVVRHDRKAQFSFASLQSDAARAALGGRALESLPDSVVLIDEQGAHVESEAALRVAKRLGFPWSSLALTRAVPRSLRDRCYRFVARHRYRWFGRQNACMVPTAELRARFLDAEEPRPTIAAGVDLAEPAEPAGRRSGLLLGWAHRFVLAYLIGYIFPFPLGSIPFTEWPAEQYETAKQALVTWVAKLVFGIEITVYPNGSGDTTYNYVELFTLAVAAAAVSAAWSWFVRRRAVEPRTVDRAQTYVRYFLAATLLQYGWDKVIPLQMPAPGPDRLLNSIGETSPMGLLWTFMGASSAYQIFAGLGEVAAGMLLLWRRTALLGALIGAGVMTNVVMLNYCYDVPVKLFSSHLLLMTVFLGAPQAVRLAAVVLLNLPAAPIVLRPFPIERRWLRRSAWALKAMLFMLFAVAPPFQVMELARQFGFLAEQTALHGIYSVDSFVRDGIEGRANDDKDRWVRFGINEQGVGAIQRASGTARRFQLKIDREKHTFTISYRGVPDPFELHYDDSVPGTVKLDGKFEGAKITATMTKLPDDASLLMSRGFHWVNEFPLNR